jgi:ubiquinone/menaquinone biosynthesis C-methylase UbiE
MWLLLVQEDRMSTLLTRSRQFIEGANNRIGTTNESSRIAWLEKTLKKIPAGGRILDAGAGEQRFKSFCSHLRYVAQDFGQYDGRGDAHGLHTGSWDQTRLDIISDITSIPEPEASFDAVMCVEVLEHLPEPTLAIREFSRLLRLGGHLVLTAPFCSLTHFAPYHFSTGFSRYFYEHHLPASGFEILELTSNGNYFEYLAQEIRRIPEVKRRYCQSETRLYEKLLVSCFLRLLKKLSLSDGGSTDFLSFGYHAYAVKMS